MSSIIVKDATGSNKYYNVIGSGTSGLPFQQVVTDYRLADAINRIEENNGDVVSVWNKAKILTKFGRNETVGTSWETLAEFQGSEPNETFLTTNIIDSIVSSSGSDTTQTIVIEGHTVDVSGNMTFVSQEAALNGQTEVTLGTPLARCNRMYVKESGTFGTTPTALVGDVVVYDNTDGITSGVPDTDAAVKCIIKAGETQSQKAATTISSTDYWILTGFSAAFGVSGGPSVDYAEVRIEIRDITNGGVWLPLGRTISIVPNQIGKSVDLNPYSIVPKNHDVRLRAKTNASTGEIYGEITGYLALVQ